MKLVVNKKKRELPVGITLLELIHMQDAPLNEPEGVLCVVNGRICNMPYEQVLCEGDVVRIMVIPAGDRDGSHAGQPAHRQTPAWPGHFGKPAPILREAGFCFANLLRPNLAGSKGLAPRRPK